MPDGHRLLVTAGGEGGLDMQLTRVDGPTWEWRYRMTAGGQVELELAEAAAAARAAA